MHNRSQSPLSSPCRGTTETIAGIVVNVSASKVPRHPGGDLGPRLESVESSFRITASLHAAHKKRAEPWNNGKLVGQKRPLKEGILGYTRAFETRFKSMGLGGVLLGNLMAIYAVMS